MNEDKILTDEAAKAFAKEYYASHYPDLSGLKLASDPFEKGWVIGPSKDNDSMSGRMGVTLLIVGRDGSVEETSSSYPPQKIIEDYLSRHKV